MVFEALFHSQEASPGLEGFSRAICNGPCNCSFV